MEPERRWAWPERWWVERLKIQISDFFTEFFPSLILFLKKIEFFVVFVNVNKSHRRPCFLFTC